MKGAHQSSFITWRRLSFSCRYFNVYACEGELSFPSEVTWGAAVGHSTGDLLAAYACGLGRQEALALLLSMGFPQAKCEAALRAADLDVERATEWLLANIDA